MVLATVVSREGTNTSSSSFLPLTVSCRLFSPINNTLINQINHKIHFCKIKSDSNKAFSTQVDYRQRSTAAGLIPNTWNRRERGLVDREVLASRLIGAHDLIPDFVWQYFL